MLIRMKSIIVIHLIYYITVSSKEADKVVQELTDCLEATLEEAELTLAADSISKGTRDLSPLGEAANLDLLFQKHLR